MLDRWKYFELRVSEKGGGGGGGGAGVVDYPDYMKDYHENILGDGVLTDDATDIMEAAQGASPFAAAVAYDPDTPIADMETAVAGFNAMLAAIIETTDWAALFTQAETSIGATDGISEAVITADVDAFADELDDEILTKVLPRFQAGMRDINAVTSSAFVLGEAVIEGFRDREVAKHSSALRLSAAGKNAIIELDDKKMYLEGSSQMLRFLMTKYSWEESYMKTVIEQRRIKLVALKEEIDTNIKIDEADALWDLQVFQYGSNVLASIGGGVVDPNLKGPSTASSVIGGALSGVAAGAMVGSSMGNPVAGAAVGGLLGAATALLE